MRLSGSVAKLQQECGWPRANERGAIETGAWRSAETDRQNPRADKVTKQPRMDGSDA